tara:strand:+ start:4505 stop:4744 length:240 start_codon:yes stop_codon:yes gene_type:complete
VLDVVGVFDNGKHLFLADDGGQLVFLSRSFDLIEPIGHAQNDLIVELDGVYGLVEIGVGYVLMNQFLQECPDITFVDGT